MVYAKIAIEFRRITVLFMHPMLSHLTLLAILLGNQPTVVVLVFTVSRFAPGAAAFLPQTPNTTERSRQAVYWRSRAELAQVPGPRSLVIHVWPNEAEMFVR